MTPAAAALARLRRWRDVGDDPDMKYTAGNEAFAEDVRLALAAAERLAEVEREREFWFQQSSKNAKACIAAERERDEARKLINEWAEELAEAPAPAGEFRVGDQVEKHTGDYQLSGEVRAVFTTRAGKVRYVVEHEPGFLHIYSEANLRPAGGKE